jgi:hypothetical protein
MTCTKRRYATHKDAKGALNRLMRERAVGGSGPVTKLEERYYHCVECDAFHVTSKKWSGR